MHPITARLSHFRRNKIDRLKPRECAERCESLVTNRSSIKAQSFEMRHRSELGKARIRERRLRQIQIRDHRRKVSKQLNIRVRQCRRRARTVHIKQRTLRRKWLHKHAAQQQRLHRNICALTNCRIDFNHRSIAKRHTS